MPPYYYEMKVIIMLVRHWFQQNQYDVLAKIKGENTKGVIYNKKYIFKYVNVQYVCSGRKKWPI